MGDASAPQRRPAAVLIPIYDAPSGPTLILIRRTPGGLHSGQVAFPGGRPEPCDAGLEDTALREAEEELGIVRETVRIVGQLPVVETIVSNYAIHPFVGRLGARPLLTPQESEVAAVLDVPLTALMAEPVEEWWELPATDGSGVQRRLIRFFPWQEDRIWGATQRMIESLVASIHRGELVL
jgi:8-oxo-dGTP pyrophosphatase MutT (NUDIX family)